MFKSISGNQTHLTLDDRFYIEHSLNEGRSLKDISRFLCKDTTTISKELRRHRLQNIWNKGSFNHPYNFCIHRFRCKKTNACEKIIIQGGNVPHWCGCYPFDQTRTGPLHAPHQPPIPISLRWDLLALNSLKWIQYYPQWAHLNVYLPYIFPIQSCSLPISWAAVPLALSALYLSRYRNP